MTQRSGEVKKLMAEPLVSNRDALAKAEFQIENFLVTKYIFQACARLSTQNSLETTQTKMDSADSSARRGGRRIPILQFATLALGLQSSSHAEAATPEQPTVSKTVSG